MEARIEDNERRLLANAEIDEEFSGDRLQRDFKALEQGANSVSADAQLLALKQKMGLLPAGAPQQNRQLGSGASGADEESVHAEIEEGTTEEKKKA
jgi:hypothetical protein